MPASNPAPVGAPGAEDEPSAQHRTRDGHRHLVVPVTVTVLVIFGLTLLGIAAASQQVSPSQGSSAMVGPGATRSADPSSAGPVPAHPSGHAHGGRPGSVAPEPAEEAVVDSPPMTQAAPAEDMSGHDHGDLSVSVLVDEHRYHVAGPVRPNQRVTVYNGSDSAATITALDGSFDVDVPPRAFITFAAPAQAGDYHFVSQQDGGAVDGFADVLLVRAGAP